MLGRLHIRYNVGELGGSQRRFGTVETLPRGLTVTGEGIKHEEHIYEDPLKSREAYSDAEPMYKVPRPISCEDMGGEPCNDAGYEIIPSTRPTQRNENVTSGPHGRGSSSIRLKQTARRKKCLTNESTEVQTLGALRMRGTAN